MTSTPGSRWLRLGLQLLLATVTLGAIVGGFVWESHSQRRRFEEQLVDLRLDQARSLFLAQLGMTRERLAERTFSPRVYDVLGGSPSTYERTDYLHIVEGWDFTYRKGDDLRDIRSGFRSCFAPMNGLSDHQFMPGWNWTTKLEVKFLDKPVNTSVLKEEQALIGQVILTAEYAYRGPKMD